MAGAASAQTQTPALRRARAGPDRPRERSGGLQEVIVTATRRAERLQDVPESITAFDTNAIAIARPAADRRPARGCVPGLSLSAREPGGTTIVFRGVASSGLSFGSVSSSALYLDEQPITQSGRNPDPRLIDIERIEALRGPQGTLYGASSQSGTLRVITNKPDPRGFDAWAEAQVLQHAASGGMSHDVSAMVNLPLVAGQAGAAAGRVHLGGCGLHRQRAGQTARAARSPMRTSSTRTSTTSKTNGGRAALRWDVSDNVDLTLSALFQDVHADGHGDMSLGRGRPRAGALREGEPRRQVVPAGTDAQCRAAVRRCGRVRVLFRSQFPLRGGCHRLRVRVQPERDRYVAVYDFGGDPRGFATNHEQTHITTFEARLQSRGGFGEPLGLAGRRVLQPGEGQDRLRQLRARLRGHAVVRVLQRLRARISRAIRSRRPIAGSSAATTASSIRRRCSASCASM